MNSVPVPPRSMTAIDRLRGLVRAWRAVQADPEVKIPTTFSLLMEAAALYIADQDAAVNDLERMNRQRVRYEGLPEHDKDIFGRPLRAGS